VSASALVMMLTMLGANWGGFLVLLWLALRKETRKRSR